MSIHVEIAYKLPELWDQVRRLDPRLLGPFLALAWHYHLKWDKPLLVTCCERTEASNQAVGGKPKSGHMDRPCRAIDIRGKGLSSDEVAWIKDFWYKNFRFGQYWSCIDDYPPDEYHLHMQCPSRS